MRGRRRWARSLPTDSVCTTWPATSGSGLATGTRRRTSVAVDGFWMSRFAVTNDEFGRLPFPIATRGQVGIFRARPSGSWPLAAGSMVRHSSGATSSSRTENGLPTGGRESDPGARGHVPESCLKAMAHEARSVAVELQIEAGGSDHRGSNRLECLRVAYDDRPGRVYGDQLAGGREPGGRDAVAVARLEVRDVFPRSVRGPEVISVSPSALNRTLARGSMSSRRRSSGVNGRSAPTCAPLAVSHMRAGCGGTTAVAPSEKGVSVPAVTRRVPSGLKASFVTPLACPTVRVEPDRSARAVAIPDRDRSVLVPDRDTPTARGKSDLSDRRPVGSDHCHRRAVGDVVDDDLSCGGGDGCFLASLAQEGGTPAGLR